MTVFATILDRAFNHGSDARIRGDARKTPYPYDSPEAIHWRKGWDHVDLYWGVDSVGPVPQLPKARGTFA